MTFQNTVRKEQAAGIIGEFAVDSPRRAESFNIDALSDAENTLVGRAFTFTETLEGEFAKVEVGSVQAAGQTFAGIAIHPKAYALVGGADGTLSPTLQLQPGQVAEFCRMGTIYVEMVNGGAQRGWQVGYEESSGSIVGIDPAAAPALGVVQIPGAQVVNATNDVGLTIIELTNITYENTNAP